MPHVIDPAIDALDRTIEMMFSHSTPNVDYDDVRDSLIMNRKRLSLPNANGGGHLRQYTTLRRSGAASMDVPMGPLREEFVSHMELRQHVAAMRGATNKHKKVEFVSHMEQKWGQENCAASWDAPTILFGCSKEV